MEAGARKGAKIEGENFDATTSRLQVVSNFRACTKFRQHEAQEEHQKFCPLLPIAKMLDFLQCKQQVECFEMPWIFRPYFVHLV